MASSKWDALSKPKNKKHRAKGAKLPGTPFFEAGPIVSLDKLDHPKPKAARRASKMNVSEIQTENRDPYASIHDIDVGKSITGTSTEGTSNEEGRSGKDSSQYQQEGIERAKAISNAMSLSVDTFSDTMSPRSLDALDRRDENSSFSFVTDGENTEQFVANAGRHLRRSDPSTGTSVASEDLQDVSFPAQDRRSALNAGKLNGAKESCVGETITYATMPDEHVAESAEMLDHNRSRSDGFHLGLSLSYTSGSASTTPTDVPVNCSVRQSPIEPMTPVKIASAKVTPLNNSLASNPRIVEPVHFAAKSTESLPPSCPKEKRDESIILADNYKISKKEVSEIDVSWHRVQPPSSEGLFVHESSPAPEEYKPFTNDLLKPLLTSTQISYEIEDEPEAKWSVKSMFCFAWCWPF
uniref:Uncharacterized protein n=1 Tax=Spongospora subterranea TaxID=70186 RepID=A0A0H5QH69_9EUKA|eukprot:CRZ00997.1 hypothetical protein [Spongospora subterranea]